MIIEIRKSKMIQFTERVLEVLETHCCDADICAVYWVKQHFRQIPMGGGATGRLFVYLMG